MSEHDWHLDQIEELCRRLEKALDLPIYVTRCRSGAHPRDGKCDCTGVPRLAALVDILFARSVPALDPRALALEEAARAIENDPLVQCGAVMDGPHFAEIVRSLGSGSESPRDQGAPARTFAWAEIHDRPGVFRGLCLVCGDSFSGIRSAGKADVERAHPEFCPACLAGRPVETGSEPTP